jgi:lysozyme family protein
MSVAKKNKPLNEILSANNFLAFTIYAEDAKKKRQVIGAATWPVDHTLFTHKSHTTEYGENEELETPDIWRRTEEISSGLTGVKQQVSKMLTNYRCHIFASPPRKFGRPI